MRAAAPPLQLLASAPRRAAPAGCSAAAAPPAARRASHVTASSRQSSARKERQYEEGDERPSDRLAGPFRLRGGVGEADDEPTADPADSLALALALAGGASAVKCVDVKVLDVSAVVSWTRVFVLATAFSRPQVGAALDRALRAGEALGREPAHVPEASGWVCLDYGDVVCHLFLPQEREFYDLQGLYANATPVPFETAVGGAAE